MHRSENFRGVFHRQISTSQFKKNDLVSKCVCGKQLLLMISEI